MIFRRLMTSAFEGLQTLAVFRHCLAT